MHPLCVRKRAASAAKAGKLLFAHKHPNLTHSMMGGKLLSSQSGEEPSSQLTQALLKGRQLGTLDGCSVKSVPPIVRCGQIIVDPIWQVNTCKSLSLCSVGVDSLDSTGSLNNRVSLLTFKPFAFLLPP